MIADGLVLGILVGLLLGGKIAHLARLEVRSLWLVVGAVLIQYGGQWLVNAGVEWVKAWSSGLYLISLAGVLFFVWLNREMPAFWLAGLGVACNALVILINGGQMPVSLDAMQEATIGRLAAPLKAGQVITHQVLGAQTLLPWLADWIPLPPPYPRPKVLSVGDIVLAIGVCWFAIKALKPNRPSWLWRQ